MENDTNLSKEGLLEPVLPGSITFDGSILAPLQNSYLYEESRECFAYNSAYLVNNAALQRRYSAFRAEKQESGYSEEELEESFGFLLFDDESEANKLADTGLLVGQETCTTLGDSSKGVYISKYSDCLDLKRWYDGKTGYIVLLKLTKGRVKEVTENYTQKFTPPSAGFDCHVSEQLGAVCGSTSSFLAFERTQYYMYELLDGNSKTEPCPRHVCPYAVVAFSYGKTAVSLELKEKSQEKTLFHYQPWIGQLMIESIVYDVGLKSIHGAMFPTNLPKSVKVEHAIRVSELRKTLPEAIFETSLVGEVCLDGRCFILYDVVSHEARSDLSLLIHELKEKDVALVINLDDNGFLVLLHSCHFLSYEGAETDKASALQGMFIFPDSRTVPRETKIGHGKSKVSSEVLQVLPALNYAESEMEKSPPSQHGETLSIVEKHLQNFATLFFPGLSSIPAREASMFPDQYDVPDGFPLIAPKWTEEAGARLKTYVKSPSSFQLSVGRTLELLAVGKQQRSDDHDDDVYYYISSPEETPQTTSVVFSERDVTDETDRIAGIGSFSDEEKNTRKEQAEKQKGVTAEVSEDIGTVERMDISCSLPTGPYVNTAADSERTLHSKTANAVCSTGSGGISEDPPIQFTGVALISTENENDTLGVVTKPTQNSQAEAEVDLCRKVNCTLEVPANAGNRMPDVDKEMVKEVNLTEPVSLPVTLVNQKDTLTGGCVEVQPQLDSDGPPQTTLHLKLLPRRRGRRKKRGLKRKLNERQQKPVSIQNTTSPSCSSLDVSSEQSSNSEIASSSTPPQNKDWRSLPRRKRHWEANTSVKRMLRSDVKANDAKSLDENIDDITEHDMTSTPKRKMEGCNMKERYGLKTIVTDCGRIFVPHGSDAAPGDVKSQIESKDDQDPSVVPANSPTEKPSTPTSPDTHAKSPTFEIEKSGQHVPLTVQNIPVITSSTTLSSQQATVQAEKDDPSHNNSDKSLDSDLQPTSTQKCKAKKGLSGTCPQVPPPVGCIESLLSVNPGLLKLPNQTSGLARQDKGGKNGWKYPTSLRLPPSSDLKSKVQESTFLHHRCICEKEGSIRVTRLWRENYDFRFDSKFTNVKLDKTVTRALHGKWDFGIEDNYEQVHLIFHMWIGLFYSKSTSRFFHFEQNCPPLDVNTSQSIDSLQTATPLPNAGSSTDEDRCTSVLRGPDILDLSVKASGPESHRTVSQGNGGEDQPKVSGKRLLPEHQTELKKPRLPPEHQTERKKQAVRAISIVSLTDSTVDDLDGDSVPENDEYSDIESDSTTKTSYTKLLENNSAYSHLCEQTLSMRIDEQQKSLTAQKNEPVFKNRGLSEALGIKSAGKTTSGSLAGLDPKALAVFHQVVGPAKPVIHSKMLDQVQGRKKIILKSLSFKEKYGDRTPTPVSKDEGHETALCGKSKGSAPVFVPGGGNKDEAASETQVVHGSASSVAVRGGNDTAKLEVKSLLDTSSDVPVNACNENSKAPEEVEHAQAETTETLQDEIKELIGPAPDLRPVLDIGDDMLANSVRPQTVREVNVTKDEVKPEHDARSDSPANAQDVNDVHDGDTCDDTPGDVKDVNYTEDEVTSVHSIRDNRPIDVLDVNQPAGITTVHSVQTDRPTNIFDINKAAKDEITAVQSVSDDIPVDVQDVCETNDVVTPVQSVSDDIPVDVQDVCETNNVVTPVQSVSDDIPVDVQNVNDSEGGVTALHSVSDITTVQGVDDETKELDKPKSDVRDCGSANEHPANEHPDVDQRAALAVDEVRKSDDVKEHMVETNENKTHEEEEELHCNDTNAETVSEKQEHTNDMQHVLALKKDSTYIADVETSDKSLKEISGSGAETLDEHVTSLKEDETAELHEQEVAAVTSLVNSRVEKSGDYAQPEIPKYSSAGCVSSDACMFSLKEGHSSPEVSDILTENDKSIMFDPSPVIQNKTPKINQLEPKEAHSDASSCFAAVNQEICTDRKHLVPTVSESLADTQDVSTPAVRVDSDVWMTSRSSTPTQDELPYTQEVCEDLRIERGVGNLQDSHSSEQTLNTVSRSPTIAESALDRSVCLNASTERHISSSMCYKVQIFPQSPHWSNNKYEATGDLTEEPKPLTQKHVPKQNFRHLVQETISSQELASKESQSQKYQYGHFSQQYGERSSELSSWAHSSSFKTDGPRRPRERYAGGQDSEIFPTHFSNSDHRDFTYMPKETIENESDIPGWVRQFHNTDAKSTVLESNERAFRHRSDLRLSESNEESESQGMGSICYSRKKFKKAFSQDEWDGEDFDGVIDYSIKKTFSCGVERTKALKTHTYCPYQRRGESRQTFDWRRYFRREGVFKSSEGNERFVHDPPSSIVTVFDKKGNRVIFENPCTLKRSVGTHSMSVQDSFHHWEDRRSKSDITQSLVELEHLIFSEKITQMLKNCKATSKAKTQHIPKVENNMTIRFSRLKEEDTITAFDEMQPTLPTLKINVDMSERKGMRKITDCGRPLHLQSLFCERGNVASCSRISNITKECTRSYNTMMNDVCAGKTIPPLNAKIRRKCDIESATCNKQSGFCGRIKKDMFDHLHDNLNSIVRQACKIKYKFYILVTSSDTFFEETKDLLEAEGHTAVEPYQFDIDGSGQTPLLILLRNEDIAEHICEVPYLLELKKSSRVLFAGIDRPDDVVNLTHQELFAKGGFVVFDEAALDALNLENMKKVVSIMEELDQKGKWKWFLHYRDSRKLRENARCSPDAQKKKHFLDCCQEAGIVEVLPYHECDVISRDIPDYLHCLVRLQIQNVSARFPVFITDTPADSFGKNGILTMNIYTFSRILSNDTCSIS
ncbi:uncharacterized protein tasor2 isoform X4 [Brachyhypopomus gauderio]|uniref:uncharacterized protein tasor2 isoform X4 n=1 Tax=Brachyhypopomus gauderio TaxID=698409 RepID=UPI0040436510